MLGLGDPKWQGIGVIIAVLLGIGGLVFGYIQYRQNQESKTLAYSINAYSLLEIDSDFRDKIQILYEDEVVTQPYLVVFRLEHQGNQEIVAEDYERPITLKFDEGTQVLSAEVADTSSENLTFSPQIVDNAVVLDTELINPDESIELKILVSNYKREPVIDYRIAGLSKIEKVTDEENALIFLAITSIMLSGSLIYLIMLFIERVNLVPEQYKGLFSTLSTGIIMIVSVLVLLFTFLLGQT